AVCMIKVSKSRTWEPAARSAGPSGVARLAPVLLLAAALGGCASTFADLPSQVGGLPAGTPERAAEPMAYPAVHDMPPPRRDVVLTAEEQKKATAELTALRTRQEKQAGTTDKKPSADQKHAGATAKKTPVDQKKAAATDQQQPADQ